MGQRRFIFLVAFLVLVLGAPAFAAPGDDAPGGMLSDKAFWPGYGVCYGPHRDGQRPGGLDPTPDQIREDLELMRPHWRLLRMYSALGPAETVLKIIKDQGWDMKVMLGIWISPDDTLANQAEIAQAVELVRDYPRQVWAVSVGNETQVSWSDHRVPLPELIRAVRDVRRQLFRYPAVPVTVADDYQFWLEPRSRDLAADLDFLTVHAHPMWNGKQLDEALPWVRQTLAEVGRVHPGKKLVLGETGWATSVSKEGEQARLIKGRAGVAEQATFFRDLRRWSLDDGQTVFYFEAFDENWKGGGDPQGVEKHWGVFQSDRTKTIALTQRPSEDPTDRSNVWVTVESSGMTGGTITSLSCEGRFLRIRKAYQDSSTIDGQVDQDSSLALVNELLALDFFDQPARYPAQYSELERRGRNGLEWMVTIISDRGTVDITLRIGDRRHTVELDYPAFGAPPVLKAWVKRFQALVVPEP